MQFSPPFQFKWPILCRKHIRTLVNSRFKSAANSPSTCCCYSSSSSSAAEHQDKSKEVDIESLGKCQLQFNSGAGGTEAAHFTRDLYEMYQRFAEWNQWQWCPFNMDFHQTGIRSAHVSVQGDLCYAKLRFEGGVHRVQRRPLTDKSRIHTSTVSIAVLPEPEKPEVMFNPGDIHIESMRSSGAGGANVNAKSTAIRILHKPTGIALKVQDERSVHANERLAYQRLSAILLKRQVDEMNRKYSGNRKLQVGTLERSEKIRTFNYKDDLVTDHRLKHSFNSIEKFLAGGEQLELMVNMLVDMYELEGLEAEEEEEKRRRSKDTEESKISSAKAK